MKKILFILFLFFSLILSATNHYVATGGGGTGTIGDPFGTIAQVNAHSYAAGDLILFNRGDTFYGTLSIAQSGSAGNPIIIGAYGTGVNPKITGFTTVSVWTDKGGDVWESTSAVSTLSICNMVTIGGVNTSMGRYPNSGYYTFQSHSGTTSITTNKLNGVIDWTGAELVIRTAQFVLDRTFITGQSTGTLTYSPVISWAPTNGYGFFIQNDVRTLDSINEWYYNPSTKKIRVYSTSEPVNVKVSSVDFTCELWNNYLTFENITFEGANNYNFDSSWSGGNTDITIKNCSILNAGIDAIHLTGLTNLLIEDNIITDSNNNGIDLHWNDHNAIIRSNTITNSGIHAGMGQGQMRQYSGIAPGYQNTCDGMIIDSNKVINSGYIGIAFEGDGILVKANYIDTYCTVLEDGGGIYTNNEGSTSSICIITGNIVLNGMSADIGTDQLNETNVAGIYLDKNSNDMEVSYNTIANSSLHGIFVSTNSNFNIHNNITYNCLYGLFISHNSDYSITGGEVNNNIFFAKGASQYAARFISTTNDISSMATFDYNYYARPIDDNNVFRVSINYWNTFTNYALAGWKTFIDQDVNSHKSSVTVADTALIDFYYNTTLSNREISLPVPMIDVTGAKYTTLIIIPPFSSAILMSDPSPGGAGTNSYPLTNGGKVLTSGGKVLIIK